MAALTPTKQRFYNNDGTLAASGKVYAYLAGTSTPTSTYTDSTAVTLNTYPIVLDAKGEANIWTNVLVKLNLVESDVRDNAQVTGYPIDYLGNTSDSNLITFIQDGTGAVTRTLQGKSRELVTPTDFGAVIDGITDCRDFIALTDTVAFTFTPGNYRISSNITISHFVTFIGGAFLSIDAGVVVTFTAGISAPANQIFSGLGTVILSDKQEAIPEWWGANGGTASGAAVNKMIAACTANVVGMYFSQNYLIETLLTFPPHLPVRSEAYAIFNSTGGAANCVLISTGNGKRQIYPSIAGFSGYAVKTQGVSLANIELASVDNCGDAIVLETINATHPNSLDNKFTVQIFGNCTNGIRVIADNSANIIQGNEFYVNFCTTVLKSVFYDASGLSPNWDSNAFVFQAIDPTPALGANTRGIVTNATGAIARCTFRCESWFGGFNTGSKYIDSASASFNVCDFYLSMAETPANYGMVTLLGTGNTFLTRARAGSSTTPIVLSNSANNRAGFNGGLPLWADKELLRVTVAGANILAGGIYNSYLYHLKTDGYSENFRVVPYNTLGLTPVIMRDNSAANANEIWVQWMNQSAATINIGTNIDFYFEIGK
jgi:hypothetical protein